MKELPISPRVVTGLLTISLVVLSIYLGYTQELHRLEQRKNRILTEQVAKLEYSCGTQEYDAKK